MRCDRCRRFLGYRLQEKMIMALIRSVKGRNYGRASSPDLGGMYTMTWY